MYVEDNSLATNRTLVRSKLVVPSPGGGAQVYVNFAEVPFAELAKTDLLDTSDLCRIFGCSARTVYRWIAGSGLSPDAKIGREWLFSKREILRWYEYNAPRPGRPPLQGRTP